MKVLAINAVPYGSTASVMVGILEKAGEAGYVGKTATGFSTHPAGFMPESNLVVTGKFAKTAHLLFSTLTGYDGILSTANTKRLIRMIRAEEIQIVHLHNLHGWYLNLPMLFGYLREHGIRVIWTLHDCWSFTGHCPHFDGIGCEKWKTGCYQCPQYRRYPQSVFDNAQKM